MTLLDYRNDFLLRLRFEAIDGTIIAVPQCDWEAKFTTSAFASAYTAMCVGGVLIRAKEEGAESVIVPFDNHGLPTGELTLTFSADIPAKNYPDGKAHVCVKTATGLRLGDDGHACSASVSAIHTVTVRLPLFATDILAPDEPTEPTEPEEPTCGCGCGCGCQGAGTGDGSGSGGYASEEEVRDAIGAAFDDIFGQNI